MRPAAILRCGRGRAIRNPRTVTVTLLDARREPACAYVLKQARPVKWTGPALDATSHDLAMEELELTADDLEVRPTRRATDD